MTAYIRGLHRRLGTADIIAPLVERGLDMSRTSIVDLCSGSGGPMIEVVRMLRDNRHPNCSLVLRTCIRLRELQSLGTKIG